MNAQRGVAQERHKPWIERGTTDWQDRARCNGTDSPEVFFPGKTPGTRTAPTAKRICRQCPVSRECLDYALANHMREGIWGGLTEMERRPLLISRGLTA